MYGVLIALHVISCLVLIMVILLQAGKGGGISETFGGSGGLQSMLGTKASSFLTKATAGCAVLFLATSLTLALVSMNKGGSIVEKELSKQSNTAPAASAMPAEVPAAVPAAEEAPKK
ncbi:MAG TPA: preprotein translocase subunit SecG [Candidatus Omnitrophota bacterium]|nr:preprotein translocase subunit SecG [Candidatus Omnitrophota bacterium]HRZ66582.1 preprotein translocase subunit SecG [Candidatus Omnitrophota bacterium]